MSQVKPKLDEDTNRRRRGQNHLSPNGWLPRLNRFLPILAVGLVLACSAPGLAEEEECECLEVYCKLILACASIDNDEDRLNCMDRLAALVAEGGGPAEGLEEPSSTEDETASPDSSI